MRFFTTFLRCSTTFLLFIAATLPGRAQDTRAGIRGTIRTGAGEPLAYAAVVAKGTQTGSTANAEGRYELVLPPGTYEIVFQFLGYQTQVRSVAVGSGFTELNITMTEQVYRLDEVKVGKAKEDPAYSIMRRAIAKARFHQLQVQSYTARVYSKASVTITDLPMEFLYRKQLKEAEKESNFKKGVPVLNETVAEVTFRQPNTYRQRVLAARNSQDNQFPSPNQFVLTSFYRPEVVNTVSPLSPKAFAYYKFAYEGTFREQGVDVSKISVTPRSYGEGVFRGTIYIIENTWAIHSLQLETVAFQGINVSVRQVYSPIRNVWMPINQRYDMRGGFMGVKGFGQYVVNLTYRNFTVNPAFVEDVQVIDEKIDKPATELSGRAIKGQKLEEMVAKQKEYSTRNLKQLIREYDRQEREQRKAAAKARDKRSGRSQRVATPGDASPGARDTTQNDGAATDGAATDGAATDGAATAPTDRDVVAIDIVRDDSTSIDTLAAKRGSVFWDSLRTVPLTAAEQTSFVRRDSLAVVQAAEAAKDSAKAAKKDTTGQKGGKFRIGHVLSGHTWGFGKDKRTTFSWSSPLANPLESVTYNTVEGVTLNGRLRLTRYADKDRKRAISLTGVGRYQTGRRALVGYGVAQYRLGRTYWTASGGRYVYQLNPDNPISPFFNTFTTLLFERNFMKLYQKDYFLNLASNGQALRGRVTWSGQLDYSQRSELANYKEGIRPLIDWRQYAYTPNRLPNDEVGSTAFPTYRAVTLNLTASMRLGATRYRIRDGKRVALDNNSPLLTLNYRRGMGVGGPDSTRVGYHFAQATISHSVETGIRSRLSYALTAGGFFNVRNVYFPDFKHFQGNEFFLQQGDATATYRMLPYYQFSTRNQFVDAHVLMEYRKFLLTQLTVVRLTGLRENVFVHYLGATGPRLGDQALGTNRALHYTEVGYGLDGLIPGVFPFFRAEVVGQFINGRYQGTGFRIGTTYKFGANR